MARNDAAACSVLAGNLVARTSYGHRTDTYRDTYGHVRTRTDITTDAGRHKPPEWPVKRALLAMMRPEGGCAPSTLAGPT